MLCADYDARLSTPVEPTRLRYAGEGKPLPLPDELCAPVESPLREKLLRFVDLIANTDGTIWPRIQERARVLLTEYGAPARHEPGEAGPV
jgi:hypothetical protein